MENTLYPTKPTFQDLAFRVGKISSACLLMAWALEALATDANPPETECLRCELFTGMTFVLETLAQQMDDVYRRLNAENTAC